MIIQTLRNKLLIDLPRKLNLQGCLQLDQHQLEIYISGENIIPLLNELHAFSNTKMNFVGLNELTTLPNHPDGQVSQHLQTRNLILTIELLLNNSQVETSIQRDVPYILIHVFWSGDETTFFALKTLLGQLWNVFFIDSL